MEGSPVERSDALLDPVADPGGGAMGTWGTAPSRRTGSSCCTAGSRPGPCAARATSGGPSSRCLAGLLSLNITFTVFVVALPTVKADFHTNFSVLAWASTGPAAGLRRRGAVLRQGGRPLRPPPALPVRPARGHGQRRSSPPPRPTSGCCCSPVPSTACRAPPPARRRWRSSSSCSTARTGSRRSGWWSLVGAGGPVLGVTLGSPVIQYFGWRTLFWGQLVLLVIASVVVAVLLPSRTGAGDGRGRSRRRRRADASSVWEGMDWVGSWSLAGARDRRHAGAQHRAHRRLDLARRHRRRAWPPSRWPASSSGGS